MSRPLQRTLVTRVPSRSPSPSTSISVIYIKSPNGTTKATYLIEKKSQPPPRKTPSFLSQAKGWVIRTMWRVEPDGKEFKRLHPRPLPLSARGTMIFADTKEEAEERELKEVMERWSWEEGDERTLREC